LITLKKMYLLTKSNEDWSEGNFTMPGCKKLARIHLNKSGVVSTCGINSAGGHSRRIVGGLTRQKQDTLLKNN
jgi:hypothetical protein